MYCLKRLPLCWRPLPLHGDTKHLSSKLLPSLVLLFLFYDASFFGYFLSDFARVLFFVCTSPCPTRPHHLVALLMFPVVESESWTTVGLLSPRCGRSPAWSSPYLCHLSMLLPEGSTSWMSPEDMHVCLTVTVSALLARTCVLQLISECTSRATHRCCLWLPKRR